MSAGFNLFEKIKRTRPNNFVGYWPMNENSGNAVEHMHAYHGLNTSVSLADRQIYGPDGGPCYYFDGTNSYCNIYAAQAAEPTLIGTASIWFACEKGYLEGTTLGRLLTLGANATTNVILIEKTATANTFRLAYIAGSTTDSVSPTIYVGGVGNQFPEWHNLAMTWSATADALKVYVDGLQSGSTQSSLGTWSGSMASTLMTIGAAATTPTSVFNGWLAHCAVWSVVLTDDEIRDLANPH